MMKKNILFIFFLYCFLGHQEQLSAAAFYNSLSRQQRTLIKNSSIIASVALGLIGTVKGYTFYKNTQNVPKNIKKVLDEVDESFAFFSDWRNNRKNKKIISQAIEKYHPATLIKDHKKAITLFNSLTYYKDFLDQENITTGIIKKKLGHDYERFEDALICLVTFVNSNKCQLKYANYMIDIILQQPYFSLKDVDVLTKATVLFPESTDRLIPLSKIPFNIFYLNQALIGHTTNLHAHRNVLRTLKANDAQKALLNKIDLALETIHQDHKEINKLYNWPIPNVFNQPHVISNATSNDPGVNNASTVFEVTQHVAADPKPIVETPEEEPTTRWSKCKKAVSNFFSKFKPKFNPQAAAQPQQQTMPGEPTPEEIARAKKIICGFVIIYFGLLGSITYLTSR